MLLASLASAVVVAVAADPQLIIWGGGTDEVAARTDTAQLEAEREVLRAVGVTLAAGYPQLLRSDLHPGLKPGFYVVTVGVCDPARSEAVLARLRALEAGVYARPLKPPALPIACPELGPAPRSFSLPCSGFGLAAGYGDRMLLDLDAAVPDGPRGPFHMAAASGDLRGRAWLRTLPVKQAAELRLGDQLVARFPDAVRACTLTGFVEGTLGVPHFGQLNETSPSCGTAGLYGVLDCMATGVATVTPPTGRAPIWLAPPRTVRTPERADSCITRLRRGVPGEVRSALDTLETTALEGGRRHYLQLKVRRSVRAEICGAEQDDRGEWIGLAEINARGCELVAPFSRYGFTDAPEKLLGWLVVDGTPHAVSAGSSGVEIADRDCSFSIAACDCGC